jgi:splicing factor 3B subunit 2
MKAKRKNRNRVAPKMGALDVDYRTLHDAFFKHQNKATIQEKLTKFGDLYYEGKEFETQKSSNVNVDGPMSERLRDALGMTNENSPPTWLINMQRYGPPPSYPNLKIPGLNAPLPVGSSYGYHLNGWGKPPVDNFGRPLFGGNPFDPPGNSGVSSTANWDFDAASGAIVTSDGKTVAKKEWGALPMGIEADEEDEESSEEESSDEESSDDEMMESEEEEGEEKESSTEADKMDGAGPDTDGMGSVVPGSAFDLRKQGGDETPTPKQLYTILHQTAADKDKQSGAVFASDVAYMVPGAEVPDGARSVLSKTPLNATDSEKRKRKLDEDDEDDDLGKKFKF